jgi:hypothetical protein
MFKPEEIQKIQRQMQALGIDKATLEKAAKSLMEIPELRKVVQNKGFEKGFEGHIDGLYEEVQNIFDDHKEHPDGYEKESKSG